jgi:chaperone modulatory protein CbpM
MISERELLARMKHLQPDVLHRWIEQGLIAPHRDATGFLFDELDEARVALICDLHYGMGCELESLPVILRLVDQLHETRHSLHALTIAVSEQPHDVRIAITERTRLVLGRKPTDGRG